MFLSVKKKKKMKTIVMNTGPPTHPPKQLGAAWLLAFHMWNLRWRASWWERWHHLMQLCEHRRSSAEALHAASPHPPGEPPLPGQSPHGSRRRASWPEPLQGAYCKPGPFAPRRGGACRFEQGQEEEVLDYRNKESRPEELTSDQCP